MRCDISFQETSVCRSTLIALRGYLDMDLALMLWIAVSRLVSG